MRIFALHWLRTLRPRPHRVVLGLAALLAAAGGDARAVSFTDEDFADADWTVTSIELPRGTPAGTDVGEADGLRVETGGNPDAYRESQLMFVGDTSPGGTDRLIGNHLRTGALYDPSTQGEIAGIDLAYDVFIPGGNVAGGGILLRQDGIFYYHRTGQSSGSSAFWQGLATSMQGADDFEGCEERYVFHCEGTGLGSGAPDFSVSGGPIEFGFYQSVSTGGTAATTFTSFIDNWSVTVHAVPEPRTGLLLLAGSALLACAPRRAVPARARDGERPWPRPVRAP